MEEGNTLLELRRSKTLAPLPGIPLPLDSDGASVPMSLHRIPHSSASRQVSAPIAHNRCHHVAIGPISKISG
jgi:hypothetical protein